MKPADVQKIKAIAAELPQVFEYKRTVVPYKAAKNHYVGAKENGVNVANLPHPVNHYQNVKKAFKKGGWKNVEIYIAAVMQKHKDQRESQRKQMKELNSIQTV